MRKVDPDNTPAPKVAQPDHAGHWGKLSNHHFAVIRLCDKEGNPKPNSPEVYGLVTDGDFSVESQWQSPFENSNPDMKAPALLGMLQSGEIAGFLGRASASAMQQSESAPMRLLGSVVAGVGDAASKAAQSVLGVDSIAGAVQSLEGLSNLTKVNSTQIFVGTAPVKLSLTLFFWAYADAKKEVEDQISLLEQWALPVELSETTNLENLINLEGLFTSMVPPFVSVTYSGKTYAPMHIEPLSIPLTGPKDKQGNRLNVSVSVSLSSRQSWDAKNIQRLHQGEISR